MQYMYVPAQLTAACPFDTTSVSSLGTLALDVLSVHLASSICLVCVHNTIMVKVGGTLIM